MPGASLRPDISVVLPTYNEAESLRRLVSELLEAFHHDNRARVEVIIVDDNSPDGTGAVADELAAAHPGLVRVLHRPARAGLGTAVVAGWQTARAPVLAVMDADGQHPPSVLLDLLRALKEGADLAVASRYVAGGQTQGWNLLRLYSSYLSASLTRLLLPRVAALRDPLSGCFAVRREVIEGKCLQPLGYKILLEVLVQTEPWRVVEVPFTFIGRQAGRSKNNLPELIRSVVQVRRLARADGSRRSSTANTKAAPRRRVGLLPRAAFPLVHWMASRAGFRDAEVRGEADEGRERRRTGVRGETYAYWYLRRHGYTVVGRNYRVPHRHGEIDLIGWDDGVLAFVEVKTRTTATGGPPEEAVDHAKQRHVIGMAEDYLRRLNMADIRYRFDILAIEASAGAPPIVRLHKGAFGSR
ncbi:MAG TPA: YraN family protein [Candidatus Xenobia bacterium]|nr:YraN family protein [Candidatus Xenobia bacterium]